MKLYMGVDMGTSSTKAALMDERGCVLSRVRLESSVISPEEGFFEVDAEGVWWKNFIAVCKKFFSGFDASSLRALCVSSVCGSFVPVDGAFRPVHNAILYGIDRRSESLVRDLNARYGEAFLKRRLGNAFSTHSVLPKILWLKKSRPDVYARTAHFVSSLNFITARLTGVPRWDVPTAHGALMLDGETEAAPQWFLEDHGIADGKIPPAAPAILPLGTVSRSAAAETGIPEGTPVMNGACDVNAEAMAVNAVMPGTAVAVFGSTLSIMLNTDAPHSLDGFMSGRSLFPEVWRIGAATASGGRTLDWGRALGAFSEAREPTGIYFIPYLDGARSPFTNPSATGAFLGLTSAHSPSDMARAVWESLGYELAMIISKMESAAPFPDVLETSGGLSNVPELMRLIADITGRTLRPHPDVDASQGDAFIAMMSEIPYDRLPFSGQELPLIRPDERAGHYAKHRARFQSLCEMLTAPGFL
ncbi:MAG: hypothetical protein LBT65_05830 [Synergistaceae bacterium]|jgi:xylulokinase|nr:hypothetical protein [Synergistaceae bacterium]